ncbi:MAG: hypothetical protein U1F43_12995 [Myxococcota bacterium]
MTTLTSVSPRPARPARATTTASSMSLVLAFMVTAALACGVLVALDMDEVETAFTLGCIAATVALGWMFALEYRRTRNALSPLCMVAFLLFLLYPFHGWMTRDAPSLVLLIGSDGEVWRTKALLVVTLSVPFLSLGYNSQLVERFAGALRGPKLIIVDDDNTTRTKLIMLYVAGYLARVASVVSGQAFHHSIGEREGIEFQFILTVLVNIPVFVSAWFIVVGLRRRQRVSIGLALVMLTGEVAWGLLTGSRMRMLAPVFAALAATSYLGKPVSLRRLVIAAVVFVTVVFPFVTAYREAYNNHLGDVQRDGLDASTVVDSVTAAASSDDDVDLLDDENPLESIAERLHGLTSLGLVLRYTPERHDYLYGVPYLLIVPQVLVPRAIWPDKPPPAQFADIFRMQYWGLEPDSETAVACSQLGDLWANLHLFGIVAGSWFYAAFIAFMFRGLRYGVTNASMFPLVVFSVQLMELLHAFEGPLDGTMAGFIKTILVYVLVAWFLSSRRRVEPLGSAIA